MLKIFPKRCILTTGLKIPQGGMGVIETTSCGGVVIHRGKLLLLYKDYNGKHSGWVLPKGTVEPNESFKNAALREVKEETSADCRIIKYIGQTQYKFSMDEDTINKTVHWYLMSTSSYYCKPQTEEHFIDAGFYKYHEAYHLLKFYDERQILKKAYSDYTDWNNISHFRRNTNKN